MPKNEISFEKAIGDLEKIIATLEGDDVSLDQALASFEKGVGLLRTCEERLSKAEGRLRELLKGEDGALVERVLGQSLGSVLGNEAFDE